MRYLIVAPHLGFTASGSILPGGLQQFGRCLVRALASSLSVEKIGIWSQVDPPGAEPYIRKMVAVHAHDQLALDVRCFNGNRLALGTAVAGANWRRSFDQVMYVLINLSVLSLLPGHLPYTVWEIGEELFQPVSTWKYMALKKANTLLSISRNTTLAVLQNHPRLPQGRVVHLCLEPPLYEPEPDLSREPSRPLPPSAREPAVMIVGSMYRRTPYKGHRQLISAWREVVEACPQAELWIVGNGDARNDYELLANQLPPEVAKQILFLGELDDNALQERYRRCRVFAMPSTGEGFGLVFVEAARNGAPGIGGRHDSVKEIVLDNETGILVEQTPADIAQACIRLLTDDTLADRMGEAAFQRYLGHFRFVHFRQRLLNALGFAG